MSQSSNDLQLVSWTWHEITVLKWPPQSPDLNPIEDLLDVVNREIRFLDVQPTKICSQTFMMLLYYHTVYRQEMPVWPSERLRQVIMYTHRLKKLNRFPRRNPDWNSYSCQASVCGLNLIYWVHVLLLFSSSTKLNSIVMVSSLKSQPHKLFQRNCTYFSKQNNSSIWNMDPSYK